MRKILISLLMLLNMYCFSQTRTQCFTQTELDSIKYHIGNLIKANMQLTTVNKMQEDMIILMDERDSLRILQVNSIDADRENIKNELIIVTKKLERRKKWYYNPLTYLAVGAIGGFILGIK